MKFNVKRTLLAGFAFLAIMVFTQMYEATIPLFLTNSFHLNESLTGIIMAMDNIFALFLIPFFGALSDKTHTKWGKRKPYILFGILATIILMNLLPAIDNSYFAGPSTGKIILFIVILGVLLVVIGTYRSPAVALMPDITPKPLRSKGNAIINLMGALGGAMFLAITALMYPESETAGLEHVNYSPMYIVVSVIMVLAALVVFFFINEPKLAAENEALEKEHPEWDLTEDDGSGNAKLPKPVVKSLIAILASIALWYMGYNAITTWYTVYCENVMGQGIGGAAKAVLVATVAAIISYIPTSMLTSKFGRKKVILAGVAALFASFAGGFFITTSGTVSMILLYIDFAFLGAGWAAISVNSLPMVVEMCKGSDVGKFTGYYYTASMAGQVITPVIAGTIMRNISYKTLFPYAALCAAGAFITMLFVKHGDVKVEAKKGLAAFEAMDD